MFQRYNFNRNKKADIFLIQVEIMPKFSSYDPMLNKYVKFHRVLWLIKIDYDIVFLILLYNYKGISQTFFSKVCDLCIGIKCNIFVCVRVNWRKTNINLEK